MTARPGSAGEQPRAGRRGTVALWGAAVAACAVCCAGPLLAVLAAVGLTAGVAAVAVPALAVVALAAFGAAWAVRRRARAGCAVPTAGPQDLGPPTVGPPQEQSTGQAPTVR